MTDQKRFTLVELLLVIAIIGIMVAIATPGDLASASPTRAGKVKTRYLFSMTGSGRIVDEEGLPAKWRAMPPAAAPSSKPTRPSKEGLESGASPAVTSVGSAE